jgi:hypothetical protein
VLSTYPNCNPNARDSNQWQSLDITFMDQSMKFCNEGRINSLSLWNYLDHEYIHYTRTRMPMARRAAKMGYEDFISYSERRYSLESDQDRRYLEIQRSLSENHLPAIMKGRLTKQHLLGSSRNWETLGLPEHNAREMTLLRRSLKNKEANSIHISYG